MLQSFHEYAVDSAWPEVIVWMRAHS